MSSPHFDSVDQVRGAYEALPTPVLLCDSDWKVVFANAAASRLLSFSQSELGSMRVDDLVPAELRDRYSGLREAARQDGSGTLSGERVLRGREGREFIVEISVVPVKIGASVHSLSCLFDVTARKRKEQETLDRLHSIVEHSEACIFLLQVTEAGTFLFESFNPMVEKLMGLQRDQAQGRPAEQLFPAEQAARMNANYRRCVGYGAPITYEEAVGLAHDRRTFRTTLVPVRGADGQVYRIVGVAHDITEQRQAEVALAESRRNQSEAEERARLDLERSRHRFSVAFDGSPDALVIATAGDGRLIDVNRGFERLFGISRAGALGKTSLELGLWEEPMDRERARERSKRDGAVRDFSIVARHASGQRLHCSFSAHPIELEGQRAFLAVIRDVTEAVRAEQTRAELEAQLRQAQKMDALGNFAGGIAHDFNNILGAILANAELIKMDIGNTSAVLEDLDELLKASDRAKDLVRRILMFSRRQPQERRAISADVPVREALRWLRSTLPTTIQIQGNIASDAPIVLADETQLQQVLMNLGANAAYAMRAKPGRLELTLEAVTVDADFARRVPELQPRRYAKISVRDSGEGISPENLAHVFEPFFTTKPRGEGTGLGLSVVHGIVREHEGAIVVESELGRGTSMMVYLPEQTADLSRTSAAPPDVPRGHGESILLVDDEEPLRRAVSALLRSLDYRVDAAEGPSDALRVFNQRPDAFDLVLADLTMPGMTGTDLAQEIHRVTPGLPVVIMSGFSGTHSLESLQTMGITDLVAKPLTAAELASCVAKCLAARVRQRP